MTRIPCALCDNEQSKSGGLERLGGLSRQRFRLPPTQRGGGAVEVTGIPTVSDGDARHNRGDPRYNLRLDARSR